MTDLISRLSAAERGSRELSDEVLLACGWQCKEEPLTVLDNVPQYVAILWDMPNGDSWPGMAPSPTESVGEALALVPGHFRGQRLEYGEVLGTPTAQCWLTKYLGTLEDFDPTSESDDDDDAVFVGTAKLPALAICIAVLRANEGG